MRASTKLYVAASDYHSIVWGPSSASSLDTPLLAAIRQSVVMLTKSKQYHMSPHFPTQFHTVLVVNLFINEVFN